MDRKERRELERKYLFFAECPECGEITEILPAMAGFWAEKGYRILIFSKKDISKNNINISHLQADIPTQEVCHA